MYAICTDYRSTPNQPIGIRRYFGQEVFGSIGGVLVRRYFGRNPYEYKFQLRIYCTSVHCRVEYYKVDTKGVCTCARGVLEFP